MNYRADLILGEAFCTLMLFSFISGRSVLTGLHFYFRRRDSENTEWVAVILIDVAFEDCDFLGDVFSFEFFDKDPDLTQFICV